MIRRCEDIGRCSEFRVDAVGSGRRYVVAKDRVNAELRTPGDRLKAELQTTTSCAACVSELIREETAAWHRQIERVRYHLPPQLTHEMGCARGIGPAYLAQSIILRQHPARLLCSESTTAKSKPIGLTARAVILDRAGRVLLVKRTKTSKHFPGQWELPGGKLEGEERLDEALVREVFEETGYAIEPGRLLGVGEFEMPHIRAIQIFFEARVEDERVRLSEEHDAYEWVVRMNTTHCNLTDQVRPFLQEWSQR